MIIKQIESFKEKQANLPSALQDIESPELKALDTDLSALLEEIYSYEPKNMGEFRSLMEFFLDLLAVSGGGDARIVSRIEALTHYIITIVPPTAKYPHMVESVED